jgi:hypothetical protein
MTSITQPAMSNLKVLNFGGASSVVDTAITAEVYTIIQQEAQNLVLDNLDIQYNFLSAYQDWIGRSQLNRLSGLDQFPITAFSNGTSESFDKFYLKNSRRRFRCFRGEYMYHQAAWRNYFPGWKFINDEPLTTGDAVVISMPFSDTGDKHLNLDSVLDQCDQLGIPVLIDCAFFGICQDIEFNFDRPCITDITFSLSKAFPVANLRIGMRLTRYDDDDSLLVHQKTNYNNRLACGVGLELIKRYSADYNAVTWSAAQAKFCEQLGVAPSKSVVFGLGGEPFSKYNRGGATNRLCFSKYLYSGILPND